MFDAGPVQVDPTKLCTAGMTQPEPLDLAFEGWSPEAFAILDRLRAHPHIEQYRKEKPGIRQHLKEPFRRYRDDLVVNWVLPNRLALETEKNVFSRLLKNDFGAGGCKDNLWMSFYRPGRKRLLDVQVTHRISPEGFHVSLFVGGYAKDLLKQAREHIAREPDRFRTLVNPLLQNNQWRLYFRRGSGKSRERYTFEAPLDGIPDALDRASDVFLRRHFARERVLEWGPVLVEHALDAVLALWPVYRFYLAGGEKRTSG